MDKQRLLDLLPTAMDNRDDQALKYRMILSEILKTLECHEELLVRKSHKQGKPLEGDDAMEQEKQEQPELTREEEVRFSGAEPVRAAAYEQDQMEKERACKKPHKVEEGDEDTLKAREEELARAEGKSLKQPPSQPVGQQSVEEYAKEVEEELFGVKGEEDLEDAEAEEEEMQEKETKKKKALEPEKEEKSGLFGRKSNKRK